MVQRLSDMAIGRAGVIQRFDDHEAMIRLMEMGCIPGACISVAAIAPLGDPIAVNVAGYCLSMRKNEARHIWIEV